MSNIARENAIIQSTIRQLASERWGNTVAFTGEVSYEWGDNDVEWFFRHPEEDQRYYVYFGRSGTVHFVEPEVVGAN